MGRNINEFFTNGDNITAQTTNVINLVGTLNSNTVASADNSEYEESAT